MRIISTMLDFISNITNIFREPGIGKAGSKFSYEKSMIDSNKIESLLDPASPLISFFLQSKTQVKKELKDYHLTKAIIELYSSTIMDSINSSSLKISKVRSEDKIITDEIISDVNYFMDKLNIRSFIKQNINDFLYFGKFCLIFKINKQNLEYTYNAPINPHDFYLAECRNESYLILSNKDNQLVKRSGSNFVCYFNEKKRIDAVPELDFDMDNTFNDNSDIDNEDYLFDLIPRVDYYTSDGLLDDNLNLLLSIYLNETLLDNLSLRDATRKDIIIADVKDVKTPRVDVANALEKLNETFNNNTLCNGAMGNLKAMSSLLIASTLSESIAVLPGHENYTNFQVLDIPDLSKKKEDLAELQTIQRNKIFTNKGIPEGIFEGIGNKWDTLQDQTRFLTEVTKYNNSVIDFILSIAVKYINEMYGLNISQADITIELGVSNTITNSKWNRDIGLQAKMLSEVSSILATTKRDINVENLCIDKRKYLEMTNSILSVVNPSLSNLILIEETIGEDKKNETSDSINKKVNIETNNNNSSKNRR